MNRDEDTIYAEALRWHAASEDDAMDWDGFTQWLEADPRHHEAYDAVALGDALVREHAGALRDAFASAAPANDDGHAHRAVRATSRRAWMRWGGAAVAASLVAMLAVPQFLTGSAQVYRTGAASETIALADGSSVQLAPHSSLEVAGRHQERMALNGGAWFDIRHDPSRTMAIEAGGVEIGDIGTRFDVQVVQDQVRVEVGEGEVRVSSAQLDRPVRLIAGRRLVYDAGAGTALVQPAGRDSIGAWRSGRLSFEATPLTLVAADLSRYAGVRLMVAESLRNRQFSGTLVTGDGEAALRDLSQLMGVELRRGPDGYVLDERR